MTAIDTAVVRPTDFPPSVALPHPQVPARSPWGRPDFARVYAPGVVEVATPGHGGIKLDAAHNARVHAAWRQRGGWYEEDCEASIVHRTFPELFPELAGYDPDESCRRWFPDEYEQVTGHKVTATESHIVSEREFYAAHRGDYIAYSAVNIGDGKVGVWARVGGRANPDGHEIMVVVTAAEYDARHAAGMVVDPAVHPAWDGER